ncbi:MAG: GNAT family N-acetyltransferase [Sulfitobacter sp.]
MDLTRHHPNDPALASILQLIRTSFNYMDGIIDPPSSMHRMTLETLHVTAATSEIWSLGKPPTACVTLTPLHQTLYLGKLCVADFERGQGHARRLISHAASRARALSLRSLTLETRVELTANQAAFKRLNFLEVARTSHKGYAQPTSITYRRML